MLCNHCKNSIYYGTRTEKTLGKQEDPEKHLEMWRHVSSESPACDRGTATPLPVHIENPPDTGPALAKKKWDGLL